MRKLASLNDRATVDDMLSEILDLSPYSGHLSHSSSVFPSWLDVLHEKELLNAIYLDSKEVKYII